MGWKQFFTPVDSLDALQAKQFIEQQPADSVTVLDVRQPAEYETGHIAGAKLIPLPELQGRMDEIDKDKQTIVYCAIGGRSRVAAQMLAGNNFQKVFNLSGGFKAWQGNAAVGPEDQGLTLFSGHESAEEILVVAYSLEKGLHEFYLRMLPLAKGKPVAELFRKLAAIEVIHQNRILEEYRRITGTSVKAAQFDQKVAGPAMEGGLSTEQYIERAGANLDQPADVISLAMAIEAQALDLYQRAADSRTDPDGQRILRQIAREEQEHLKQLGELFNQI
ncbi:MAG TPA: sulfurtransferase [Desulfobulbaceae bacterium]|nr:sulfurtransferase [Desulfobulbaceae bacterium]